MTRPLLFLSILTATTAVCQPFSVGLKAGVPLTDLTEAGKNRDFNYLVQTNRYIVGVTGELRLPFGLGVEVDALYRHLNYTGTGTTAGTSTAETRVTTGNAWEFPILAKYRFSSEGPVRPYVDAGLAWDTLQGLKQVVTKGNLAAGATVTSTSNPAELSHTTTRGIVVGAGIDFHALLIHIVPEIRYTRWGARHFLDPNGGLHSNQNQAEFLVGITF
jgi:opacity protein-like surface antigen